MAKKSRRTRRKTSRKVSQPVSSVVSGAGAAAADPLARRQEYAYVVTDIRQVAVLAAAMFVLLIGLSFFFG